MRDILRTNGVPPIHIVTSDGICDAEPNGGDERGNFREGENAENGNGEKSADRAQDPAVSHVINHATQEWGRHHGNVVHRPGVVG